MSDPSLPPEHNGSDDRCLDCGGAGEFVVNKGDGDPAYDVAEDCKGCGGSGREPGSEAPDPDEEPVEEADAAWRAQSDRDLEYARDHWPPTIDEGR